MAKIKGKIKISEETFPVYCDYSCKFADFSDPNAIGACRKELAVWCTLLQKYNNKNNKCIAKDA